MVRFVSGGGNRTCPEDLAVVLGTLVKIDDRESPGRYAPDRRSRCRDTWQRGRALQRCPARVSPTRRPEELVADWLGWSVSQVKSLLYRAHETMRKKLTSSQTSQMA